MNNIFGRIKSLVSNIRKLKNEFDEIIRKNSDYLACGTYKVAPSLKMAYNKKYSKLFLEEDKNCFAYVINRRSFEIDGTTRLSKKLFIILYRYNNKKAEYPPIFSGDAILVSTNNKTNRFINAEKHLILAKYGSKTAYDKAIENRNKWEKYFNTTPLSESNSNLCYTIEQYILRRPVSPKDELMFILDSYIKAMPSLSKTKQPICQDNSSSLKAFCERLHIEDLYDKLYNLMKNDCSNIILTHGDTSFLNILYDGDKFYYIDLDSISDRVFFYDFFFYVYSSAAYFMDFSLLDSYLQGCYDKEFSVFWQSLGLQFIPEDRFAYIFYFLYYAGIASSNVADYIYKKYKDKLNKHRHGNTFHIRPVQ